MAIEALPESSDAELQATAWDLEPLVDGEGTEGVERRLQEALDRARAFAERHAGDAELQETAARKAVTIAPGRSSVDAKHGDSPFLP